jgi:hypothetical protein
MNSLSIKDIDQAVSIVRKILTNESIGDTHVVVLLANELGELAICSTEGVPVVQILQYALEQKTGNIN